MQEEGRETKSTHAEPPRFVEIVAELEDFTGRRLRGENRALCLYAFAESEAGFARCAQSARLRARLNPLGLLIQMVKDREHTFSARMRVDDREQMRAAGQTPPCAAVCFHCEVGGGRHAADCPEAGAA